MESIPPRLQGELAIHLHMETLKKVDLFVGCDESLLYELVVNFKFYLTLNYNSLPICF